MTPDLLQLESLVAAPTGVTVARVAGHFGIGALAALKLLRALAQQHKVSCRLENGALIFRRKETVQ